MHLYFQQLHFQTMPMISNNLLWPPDGLNMATSNNGEFLGYGYLPMPFTEEMSTTNGVDITTGNQSWTLFLNTQNFKGPAAFFLPTFWTKPVLENASLEGLFLDTRPSNPLSTFGFETATLPVVNSTDNNGTRYSKALPTRYPITEGNESVLLNRPMVYSKDAMWNNVESWFNGGAVAPTTFSIEGQLEILFDPQDSEGSAFFESKIKSQKSWICISYRSKNMKWKCGKSYKLFYFQVRESPAPLNIPTPTPAPDHLLGGHNELKTTSVE